ncbi:hypothetical protein [Nocardia abscessus]|jgi:hypothetical protein|uniref:hypothetical protein n=1 Tax=Nocardia abscessus TaxID=120957 RepID=UPI002453F43A|nr:hypothetical protein [Nocardia abscessus]
MSTDKARKPLNSNSLRAPLPPGQRRMAAPDLAEIDRQRQPFASLIRSNPPADVEPRATAERAWNPET